MRLTPLLALVLFVAACGGASKQPAPVGASGPGPQRPTSTRPPSVFLESAAGRQQAVLGSYCVDAQLEGGCADSGPIHPAQVTVARSGEAMKFVLENAQVRRPPGCVAPTEQACIGAVTVRPLGCARRSLATIPLVLGRETRWTVDLEPGAYQLDAFAYFESDDGRTGDVSESLGLLVDTARPPGIVPIGAARAVCQLSD
jgi:hypothetical protein